MSRHTPHRAPGGRPPAGRASPSRATVARGFVDGLLSGLAARGEDPAPLLERAGIAPAPGGTGAPQDRVGIGQYERLYNAVVEHLSDEGFALFRRPVPPGSFEFLCRSVLSSPTLAEALDRASRYLRMVVPDLAIEVRRGGAAPSLAELRIAERRPLQHGRADPRRVFAFEWMLRLLHALACWLAARDLPFTAVRFPYPPPAHAADYALIYAERASFEDGVPADALVAVLPANLLDLPVRRDEDALGVFLKGAPGKIVALYRRDREMVRRVRELVQRTLPGSLALPDVARRLNLSTRTVERRLLEEGSSLRAIKDALRRDIALARLEKTELPVETIAASLGYADTSAFFRAFRAWTGLAPTAYRARRRPA